VPEDYPREVARLNEGLKTCRAMIADYRAMLGGDRDERGGSDRDMSRDVSSTSNADESCGSRSDPV
jgi:hypothetical protein